MPINAELQQQLQALIARGAQLEAPRDERQFENLALQLFAFQFATLAPYRELCEQQGRSPASVRRWQEIPTLAPQQPVQQDAATAAAADALARRAVLASLCTYLFPDAPRLAIFSLVGDTTALAATLQTLVDLATEHYGTSSSGSYGHAQRLDAAGLAGALQQAQERGEPVCLLGQLGDYATLLDYLAAQGLWLQLPAGSRLLDTSTPGRSPAPRSEQYARYRELLGLPLTACIGLYAPAGVATPFFDSTLYDAFRGQWRPRHKAVPPWVRTRIVDQTTLQPVEPGQVGLLQHFDLANLAAALACSSNDLGVEVGPGFEVLARADAST